MKLRHRVLGKLVEALQPPDENGRSADEARDTEMILEGRRIEAQLYAGSSSSKSEYQNKAMGKIKEMRRQQQQQQPHETASAACDRLQHTLADVKAECRLPAATQAPDGKWHPVEDGSDYVLQPADILLTASELSLNLFPMTSDMNARAEQEMQAAGMAPADRLVRSGEYDPRRGWRRSQPPTIEQLEQGTTLVAIDCEMVDTTAGHELARLSVTSVTHETLADIVVMPPNPILDYLTQWSGITEELLADVTTTLANAQDILLEMVHTECILVGHSLENDLRAMKIAHDRVIDTSVCFPRRVDRRRERGGGKQSLRFLADNMLNLEIQTAGDDGHDSTEDASTAMRLALLRLRFGFDDVRIHNYARARSRLAAAEQDAMSASDSTAYCPALQPQVVL